VSKARSLFFKRSHIWCSTQIGSIFAQKYLTIVNLLAETNALAYINAVLINSIKKFCINKVPKAKANSKSFFSNLSSFVETV